MNFPITRVLSATAATQPEATTAINAAIAAIPTAGGNIPIVTAISVTINTNAYFISVVASYVPVQP
jgi:hypothetical protein